MPDGVGMRGIYAHREERTYPISGLELACAFGSDPEGVGVRSVSVLSLVSACLTAALSDMFEATGLYGQPAGCPRSSLCRSRLHKRGRALRDICRGVPLIPVDDPSDLRRDCRRTVGDASASPRVRDGAGRTLMRSSGGISIMRAIKCLKSIRWMPWR